MNGRERFYATLRGEPTDRLPAIPISMMVAADLIDVPYVEYATDYRLQVRGQLAFAEKFDFDHVSAISDPATEAADCGAEVTYHPTQPPALDEAKALLRDKATLVGLPMPVPTETERMSNRLRVVEELKRQGGARRIVEGWVEGPIAEACDLRGINRFMMDLYDDPPFVNDLLAFIFEMEMAYAEAQVRAGADVIGVGDAAASLIGGELYDQYALDYHTRYVERIHEMGTLVRLHVCGNATHVLPRLDRIRPDVMDLDSLVSVGEARAAAPSDQVLTGNIDPVRVLQRGTPESIGHAFDGCYRDADRRRYMVAAGCEIPRGTPDANIAAMATFAARAVAG